MKSSVSLTVSAAVSSAPPAPQGELTPPAAFEALLVPALLKPVLESLGPLGAAFGDAVARATIGSRSEPS